MSNTPEQSRRRFLTRAVPGAVAIAGAFMASPVQALESCALPQSSQPGKTADSCVVEGYLEVAAYLYNDSNKSGRLDALSEIDTWIPGRGFRVTLSSKLKAGASYDSRQELKGEDIARVVDFTHSGIAVARLVTAESGRGFAGRAFAASGEPFADDNLEAAGYSYAVNPETGHPAILVRTSNSAVELWGPGFDREKNAHGLIKKVAYIVEVMNDDGNVRVANGRIQRFYETMGVCDPRFGISTDQNINSTLVSDYKASDLRRDVPVELPMANVFAK